jgi:hypothetical protein
MARTKDSLSDFLEGIVTAARVGWANENEPPPDFWERILTAAIARLRTTMGRPDDASAAREALSLWLSVFDMHLQIVLPRTARGLYREPIWFMLAALQDLDRGVVDPIFIPPKVPSGRSPHGCRSVDFKVRCVRAADEIYESGRTPARKRPSANRETVDKIVERRVKSSATAYGLSMAAGSISQWRKDIKRARPDQPMALRDKAFREYLSFLRGKVDIVDYLIGGITDPTRRAD